MRDFATTCHTYVFAGSVLLAQAHQEDNQEHFLGFTDLNQRETNGPSCKAREIVA
ncbi:hypothetical protein WN51_03460 [Melipona quadrifasciata]|uniref:Uncharacterized protein n=1 Tax=Melipona quadrifasciata TaxID=166423 RepID=A0A0N0BKX9_9HYME|nr:hypothetical protein WN51_03460 [Melipona quadrifasciata]